MELSGEDLSALEKRCHQLREEIFIDQINNGGYHFGGPLSSVEILTTLYKKIMNHAQDKCILAKGHAGFGWYPLLRDMGYNPKMTEHPDMDVANGVHCTTGSLGHGFPQGMGMAYGRKLLGKPGKIYVVLGEGDAQEGSHWESLLLASHHKLDNLVGILDENTGQGSGLVKDILSLGTTPETNVEAKFRAFGASVYTCDGHSIPALAATLDRYESGKPTMIVAKTIKGKGISFMEAEPGGWHARFPTPDQLQKAYDELGVPHERRVRQKFG